MAKARRHPRALLDELRTLRNTEALHGVCEELGIRLLVAFGSALRTDGSEPRDLDLAAELDDGRDFPEVVAQVIRWLRSDAVDLLDLRHAGVVARYEALVKGELLYEREPGTFDGQRIAAALRFADTRWIRDLQLEALRQ
jgi:predicted nucleotidyltransferase